MSDKNKVSSEDTEINESNNFSVDDKLSPADANENKKLNAHYRFNGRGTMMKIFGSLLAASLVTDYFGLSSAKGDSMARLYESSQNSSGIVPGEVMSFLMFGTITGAIAVIAAFIFHRYSTHALLVTFLFSFFAGYAIFALNALVVFGVLAHWGVSAAEDNAAYVWIISTSFFCLVAFELNNARLTRILRTQLSESSQSPEFDKTL